MKRLSKQEVDNYVRSVTGGPERIYTPDGAILARFETPKPQYNGLSKAGAMLLGTHFNIHPFGRMPFGGQK